MSPSRQASLTAVFSLFLAPSILPAAPDDYSGQPIVVEKVATEITFAADGTGRREQTWNVRVQSEEGVRALGVLTVPYNADNENPEVVYVRVRKPDGSVVATPPDGVQDIASEVTRVAPTYSDLREKQIPVRALSAGDVLEYRVRVIRTKPDIPNQFWYTQSFVKDAVVLEETLRITAPANQYVKVASATVQPEVSQSGAQKSWFWKTANLKVPDTGKDAGKDTDGKDADDKAGAESDDQPEQDVPPSVQITTFRSWEEIGRWYSQLADSRTSVTPAIAAKAAEVTKGLASNAEKLRAIYAYVSLKFRYIAISFGQGRFQPHAADEVLANQYGDCKDKHTLFAAMLKAVGIEAWPALIGAGIHFDSDVPSPAQFNHVITVIPDAASPDKSARQWLDTTPEVAPFGLLQPVIRDKQALVIPVSGAPQLMNTPAKPPFPNRQVVEARGDLGTDGKLKRHIDLTLRGDEEVDFRAAFRSVAPAQWQDLAQRMAALLGYSGTVSHAEVDNLNNPDTPFHFAFDYTNESYGDWPNRRITALTPPLVLTDAGNKKPAKPIELPEWGEFVYRSSITIPSTWSVEVANDTHTTGPFGSFDSVYSMKDSTLIIERHLTLDEPKIQPDRWSEYARLSKAVNEDADHWIVLSAGSGKSGAVVSQNNPEAEGLVQKALAALQRRDLNEARDALAQAERLNPRQSGLWSARAMLAAGTGDMSNAVAGLKKEIQFHPDQVGVYRILASAQMSLHDTAGAITTLRDLLKVAPADEQGTVSLATLLNNEKRYKETIDLLRPALEGATGDVLRGYRDTLSDALLRNGQKEEGIAMTKAFADSSDDPNVLNDAAWHLADTGTDLPMASAYARKGVAKLEESLASAKLESLTDDDLRHVMLASAIWDTLGWALFQSGDDAQSEKYLQAAWRLAQQGPVADHLGQIYEKQGRKDEARHLYELAVAAGGVQNETTERLDKLGGPHDSSPRPTLRRGGSLEMKPADPNWVPPAEELGQLRTTGVPLLTAQKGTAEFFISLSKAGVEETRFISGDQSLKDAGTALSKTAFKVPFPDDGPERLIRRGILSCSAVTKPACQIVFLLPANTTAN